jgi:hypothetical protein
MVAVANMQPDVGQGAVLQYVAHKFKSLQKRHKGAFHGQVRRFQPGVFQNRRRRHTLLLHYLKHQWEREGGNALEVDTAVLVDARGGVLVYSARHNPRPGSPVLK